MTNTKERQLEILDAIIVALKNAGGINAVNDFSDAEQRSKLRDMRDEVVSKTNCHPDIARRNITNVIRQMRGEQEKDNWGGVRKSTKKLGRPPFPQGTGREAVSTRLAPGSKELAKAIAKVYDLPGWGHAVDEALKRMAEEIL